MQQIFFVSQHIEVRGKPLPFIRKAKHILKVVVKGVHPEMTNMSYSQNYILILNMQVVPGTRTDTKVAQPFIMAQKTGLCDTS